MSHTVKRELQGSLPKLRKKDPNVEFVQADIACQRPDTAIALHYHSMMTNYVQCVCFLNNKTGTVQATELLILP